MFSNIYKKAFLLLALSLLVLTGCGGEPEAVEPVVEQATNTPVVEVTTEEPTAEPATATPEEPTATPEPTAEPDTAVTELGNVKSATIQIQAEGSFVDPQVGLMLNTAGRGSGFIIDPSGIAVTNNHVVTGAALIKVWVGGEEEPRNARVLGVSECSDLAVIDIDGEDYPYLKWYDGNLDVGLDVYAAGFPLGDPEFTLTRGIISKARANGETSWASVDYVLEHDATINPGNSGGPLVNAAGQIVGVNYAGAGDTKQYFAIVRDEAQQVISQLRDKQDVTSIGVNGTAVSDGQSLSGIWVASVKSGSPADKAGIKGGDIITTLEGLVLAVDGTMSDYCDILRTHDASDTLSIEVLRFDTQELLAGQLNGRELEQTFSFAQTLEEQAADTPENNGTTSGAATYTSYQMISDDSGSLQVEVPTEWSDIDGSPWIVEGEEIGVKVSASPNLNEFNNSWLTPGIVFGASSEIAASFSEEELLDLFDLSGSCTRESREAYDDDFYTGYFDLWTGCGDGDTLYIIIAAEPAEGDITLLVQVQVVTDADLDALDHILASFIVNN